MSEYMPSTEDVAFCFEGPYLDAAERRAAFDRWLAGVRAEAKAEALTEAADAMDADVTVHDPLRLKSDWIRIRAARIREGGKP